MFMLPFEELIRQVRRRRIALGLTQTQLAALAGTSQSLVAKLEQGRINPSYETVRRVVIALEQAGVKEEPTAGQLMHNNPITAAPDETIGAALDRMKTQGFSQLPVLDGHHPVGAISERDIIAVLERGEPLEALKRRDVAHIMKGTFPTVDPSTSRRMLVELLREQDAVLVVENGKVVGLVTKSDLW